MKAEEKVQNQETLKIKKEVKRNWDLAYLAIYQLLYCMVFVGSREFSDMDLKTKTVIIGILSIVSIFFAIITIIRQRKEGFKIDGTFLLCISNTWIISWNCINGNL